MSKSLASVQADFQDYLMSPSLGEFAHLKKTMLSHVDNQFGLSAENRLEIYYDMYRLRMLDVLYADYPKLVAIMGEEKFTQAFLHYLLHYPSTHYSVRPFGSKLAHFLSEFEPFCKELCYAEMAKFEWALSLTYDAADRDLFNLEKLKNFSPEQWVELKCCLHPSVSMLTFEYNAVSVWKTLNHQKILPEPESDSVLETYPEPNPKGLIEKMPASQTWLVWRKDGTARFKELSPEQYLMLEAMNQGLNFSDVCEKLASIMPEENIPSFVMPYLVECLSLTVLCPIE